jgi:hypothetical protein
VTLAEAHGVPVPRHIRGVHGSGFVGGPFFPSAVDGESVPGGCAAGARRGVGGGWRPSSATPSGDSTPSTRPGPTDLIDDPSENPAEVVLGGADGLVAACRRLARPRLGIRWPERHPGAAGARSPHRRPQRQRPGQRPGPEAVLD